ncbi:multicopper oxidase abr1 [Aspergillus pseudoviridinutans]|uniref:Multicopper oxidase abr1 n=1 Tax=Aspergillus pseudoviridinutans TaxID=1517512 RepID=A0A9P3BHJ9_9EURO|nr:multicopper oxidase abr1 [Aspergillus pseudoviridinutans]GIJ89445.1 multicopper oxidase abr1 [Aspergillus pseudoviridinutans]
MFHSRALLFSWLAGFTAAKDIHLDWNITWVWAAPDGFGRPMIGINDEWPCPIVNADLGDRLIVDVHNGLGNQSTGIHWHGFHQYMTGTMDGSNQVTQCALPPGSSMRYEFEVNQTGTYWYHSHEMGQYPDGLRGPFIVRDPSPPFAYDDEFTLTLTDHYHEQMPVLLQQYEADSVGAQAGVNEPLPAAALINEGVDSTKLRVEPNKTYLIHLVCVGNWPGHVIVFDGHEISVVEVDGVWVDTYPTGDKKIRLATGQRMSILLKTKDNADANYAIWDSMDVNMMFFYENRSIPDGFNPNATAWLVYDEAKELPPPPDVHELDPNNDFVDDLVFVPANHEPLLEKVDRQIILNTGVTQRDGRSVFAINGQTYVDPGEPTMYTALAASPETSTDESIYGQVNPFVVQYGEVVEIVINNHHGNLHPWHLHGHQFQVLQRTYPEGGYFDGYFANISSTPVKRDTIMGLTGTIIEAPAQLHDISVPLDHQKICPSYGTPAGDNTPPNDAPPADDTNKPISPAQDTPQAGGSPGSAPAQYTPQPGGNSGPSALPQYTPQPSGAPSSAPAQYIPQPEGPPGSPPAQYTPQPWGNQGPPPPAQYTPQPWSPPSNAAPPANNYPPAYAQGYPAGYVPVAPGPIIIDSEFHSGGKSSHVESSGVKTGHDGEARHGKQ